MGVFRQQVFLALCALSTLAHPEALSETGKRCTNTPTTRQCWRDGYDINTDYYKHAPKGQLRKYHFSITQQTISPNGYEKTGFLVNGQYPGPTIEANWGDTLRITVQNNFKDNFNGTGIHWHGIRQLYTNWLDGVPGVTQCPIKPGDTQVYEFKASQYGTSWYHSHFSLQYSNGLYGPIVIHGPSSANYDVDLGPWILNDWYYQNVFDLNQATLATNAAALPNATLLNGMGVSNCDSKDPRCKNKGKLFDVTFTKGKKYKIRLINTSTIITYTFWIQGHNFTVIQNDFVPIEPYKTNVLNVGIGQRYEILVEANADTEKQTNYWLHAQYCSLNQTALVGNKIGIIRYNDYDQNDPPADDDPYTLYGCNDPSTKDLVPFLKKNVGVRANGMSPKDYLNIGIETNANATVFKWVLKDVPLYADWEMPSVQKLITEKKPQFPAEASPITLDFKTGEWVYFVMESNFSLDAVQPHRVALPPLNHPIHLHGHDFMVLGQGEGPFPQNTVPVLKNPARRDVANVPVGGWLWIAFQIDNPGAWLMHCHNAFHASDGLALQFLEQPSKLRALMKKAGALSQFKNQCKAWSKWYKDVNVPHNATQADSGI